MRPSRLARRRRCAGGTEDVHSPPAAMHGADDRCVHTPCQGDGHRPVVVRAATPPRRHHCREAGRATRIRRSRTRPRLRSHNAHSERGGPLRSQATKRWLKRGQHTRSHGITSSIYATARAISTRIGPAAAAPPRVHAAARARASGRTAVSFPEQRQCCDTVRRFAQRLALGGRSNHRANAAPTSPSFIRFRELNQRVGTRCFSSSCQFSMTARGGLADCGEICSTTNRCPSRVTSYG